MHLRIGEYLYLNIAIECMIERILWFEDEMASALGYSIYEVQYRTKDSHSTVISLQTNIHMCVLKEEKIVK